MTLPASGAISFNNVNVEIGRSGTSTISLDDSPVRTLFAKLSGAISMSDGYGKTYVAPPQGRLWMWGTGASGALGDNSTTAKSSPVQTAAAGTNWASVATGSGSARHTGAVKVDGTLWMWGSGASYGMLGDGGYNDRSSPVQTSVAGTSWKEVSTLLYDTIAIKINGSLWGWGYNFFGEAGKGDFYPTITPTQSPYGTTWSQISSGAYTSSGIKTDGTLWSWGRGDDGSLGNNSTSNQTSPVQTVSAGTNWKQNSVGTQGVNGTQGFASAVKTDGTLWLWGLNASGQLGTNNVTNRSSPVQTVSAGTNWSQVSAGTSFTASIKTDGTLWLWGLNSSGQLGTNNTTIRSSPVQTISGGTNWKQIGAGATSVSSIKTDGTLWTWGTLNANNSAASRSSPVQIVSAGTTWIDTSSVGDVSMGIRT